MSNESQDDPGVSQRLAVYGSLRPGQPNHDELDDLNGQWRPGVVHGHLHHRGWGAELGYPGVVLDPNGPAVSVMVLISRELPHAWTRLDQFEGSAYRRSIVTVELDDGTNVLANIYELSGDPSEDLPSEQPRLGMNGHADPSSG